jgi:hypothetical protein
MKTESKRPGACQLIDDEVFLELSRFAVRVLVSSDSCHGGTVVPARVPDGISAGRSKIMPLPSPEHAKRRLSRTSLFSGREG